ncbi:MAG: UDP-N-acetylmuramoyl-L-alanine--D-glutamate ligase, partial [Candidatus Omnitrophica bacterium]|nr:UDP-N-acetylmuramoyl-L-alanine--D-glutamate ligase [Candidatus Omnitrophota bacterium]
SFQLERARDFKPKVAVILNFSCNHLDRHKDMGEYLEAKKRIYMNQDKDDYLVLNADDKTVFSLKDSACSKVAFFNKAMNSNPNYAAAQAVGGILGADEKLCQQVFADFKGVEHRLEQVARIDEITFINDSKATTIDATIWALTNTPKPIILIAGGREKGNDYRLILDLVREKVKRAILIGESGERIVQALSPIVSTQKAKTMEEAVKAAFSLARPGDCVLLSPMCKSFDMFTDYEERGRIYKKAVSQLKKEAA